MRVNKGWYYITDTDFCTYGDKGDNDKLVTYHNLVVKVVSSIKNECRVELIRCDALVINIGKEDFKKHFKRISKLKVKLLYE